MDEKTLRKEWHFEHPDPEKRAQGESLPKLGQGTFGVVYEVHDPSAKKESKREILARMLRGRKKKKSTLAVKVMRVQPKELDEALREITVHRELGNSYPDRLVSAQKVIPLLVDVNSSPVYEILFTTATADKDLRKLLFELYKMTANQVMRIVWDIACGLDLLHSKDLTHNDLKPENVLIYSDGKARISDYGLVLRNHPLWRRPATQYVTATYRSPEQSCLDDSKGLYPGEALSYAWSGPKVDMWAFGWILLEMVASILSETSVRLQDFSDFSSPITWAAEMEKLFRVRNYVPRIFWSKCKGFDKAHTTKIQASPVMKAENPPSVQDGARLMKAFLEVALPSVIPPFLTELLLIASHLLRFHPSERWNAREVMQHLEKWSENLFIKSIYGSMEFHPCPAVSSPLPLHTTPDSLRILKGSPLMALYRGLCKIPKLPPLPDMRHSSTIWSSFTCSIPDYLGN